MYFLSDAELETCPVAERLDNGVKLMRKVDVQILLNNRGWDKFFKCGRLCRRSNLALYAVDWVAGAVSIFRFNELGDTQQYTSHRISKIRSSDYMVFIDGDPYVDGIYFDSLPIFGVCKLSADRRGLEFSFIKIPEINSGEIEMEDVKLNIGSYIIIRTVLQSSDYVAVILLTGAENTSDFQGSQLWLLLFESRLGKENCYKFIQLCQRNLNEYITKENDVETMIYNKTAAIMLFSVLIFPNKLMILIYNMKTHNIEQMIEAFENVTVSKVFFVDHADYEGGVIVAASKTRNQINLFSKCKGKYTLLKCLSLNISQSRISSLFCHSNRKNQILFFNGQDGEMYITDLFNPSNVAIIEYDDRGYPELFSNETGEEIYVYYQDKICVYLYRSKFKSLLLHCAYIVASLYTENQLNDMKLPKHLYKYFRAFQSLFFRATTYVNYQNLERI